MRSRSFTHHLTFKDICTSDSRNLCLFDVDCDQDNELIIGSWDSGQLSEKGEADADSSKGSVHVIKYNRIWKVSLELGMDPELPKSTYYINQPNKVGKEKFKYESLKIVHHQQIAYNAKDVCVVTHGDTGEIAVAYSDRVVRLYKWSPHNKTQSSTVSSSGEFVLLIKWELAGQVNRIDTHWTEKYGTMIVASQPSGGFVHLHRKFEKHNDNIVPTLTYYPPYISKSRNLETRTWLVGNLQRHCTSTAENQPSTASATTLTDNDSNSQSIMVLCLADGTILFTDLVAEKQSERLIWCAQLHIRGELFGLSKFNLTKDDGEEACACAWDGTTYVFSHRKQLFRFPLGQSCQAFTAGNFATHPGNNEPVFVYATFDRNIIIYYNLDVGHVALPTLFSTIQSNEVIIKQMEFNQIDPQNRHELQQTVHYLLYELPKLGNKFI